MIVDDYDLHVAGSPLGGSHAVNAVPPDGRFRTCTAPPNASIRSCVVERPSPRSPLTPMPSSSTATTTAPLVGYEANPDIPGPHVLADVDDRLLGCPEQGRAAHRRQLLRIPLDRDMDIYPGYLTPSSPPDREWP